MPADSEEGCQDLADKLGALALAAPADAPEQVVKECNSEPNGASPASRDNEPNSSAATPAAPDATTISDDLARLALSDPAAQPSAEVDPLALQQPAGQPEEATEADSKLTVPAAAPDSRATRAPPRARKVSDMQAAAADNGRRRSVRSGAAATEDQENLDSANTSYSAATEAAAASAADGKAVRRDRRRSGRVSAAGAATADDTSAATPAQAPQKAAAKRVMAMRQFWEATAQKEGRPRPGAQGLPHKSRVPAVVDKAAPKQRTTSVQDWSDDD